ncbi:MAG: DUF2868 domain-containing protein [Planctomycetia bacterium]|nr:DUF2868 domain-containing protein [Planctomycetia bacterium]
MPSASRTLTLADLVDLELQLAHDRDADAAEVRRRDAEIAARLQARNLSEPALFLAWLDELRKLDRPPAGPSPGRRTQQWLDGTALVLVLLGLLAGGSAVSAWLVQTAGQPVNVIFFWCAIVGLQLPLLLLWIVAALPGRWLKALPGAATLQWMLRALAQWPARAAGWLVARFAGEGRTLLDQLRGQIATWSWVYGPLRLWILIRLTQVFAVAFNVGAVAAFVAISYGSDPAFGWKSTLLTADQVHSATRVVSVPWRVLPDQWSAVPLLDDVRHTKYKSLDPQYEPEIKSDGPIPWASWYSFLLLSILCYGLLPRLVTLAIAAAQVRRTLAAIRLDHSEFQRLAQRLARPRVETQATRPEAGAPASDGKARPVDMASAKDLGPCTVLRWAGVDLPPAQLVELVARRTGWTLSDLHAVGGLDPTADEAALIAIESSRTEQLNAARPVVLLVEAWEPPVGDYLDFIAALRQRLGRERTIQVLLFDRDAQGNAAPARPDAVRMWESRLAGLGDPWLWAETLVESPAEETRQPSAAEAQP